VISFAVIPGLRHLAQASDAQLRIGESITTIGSMDSGQPLAASGMTKLLMRDARHVSYSRARLDSAASDDGPRRDGLSGERRHEHHHGSEIRRLHDATTSFAKSSPGGAPGRRRRCDW